MTTDRNLEREVRAAAEARVAEESTPGYDPACNFCGKPKSEVRTMIAGRGPTFICDECVELASRAVEAAQRG